MRLAVLGSGRVAAAAARLAADLPERARLVSWHDPTAGPAPGWARSLPRRAAAEPPAEGVDGVVVDLAPEARAAAVIAALGRGLAVLADSPPAVDAAGLRRVRRALDRGGGRLTLLHPLRRDLAVRDGQRLVRGAGRTLAVYASLHRPRGDRAPLTQDLADLCGLVVGLVPGRLVRVQAVPLDGGGGAEGVAAIARLANGAILTLEVARCLPPEAGVDRRVVVEVTGAAALVRIAPEAAAVTVDGAVRRTTPWRQDLDREGVLAYLAGEEAADMAAEGRLVRMLAAIAGAQGDGPAGWRG